MANCKGTSGCEWAQGCKSAQGYEWAQADLSGHSLPFLTQEPPSILPTTLPRVLWDKHKRAQGCKQEQGHKQVQGHKWPQGMSGHKQA